MKRMVIESSVGSRVCAIAQSGGRWWVGDGSKECDGGRPMFSFMKVRKLFVNASAAEVVCFTSLTARS